MLDFIRNWIINITVVMIFIMLLETVLPNSDMKRYVNVVVGLLIVVVIISPFMQAKDITLQFNENVVETAAYMEKASVEDRSAEFTRYQKYEALELYKDSLRGRIARLLDNNGLEGDAALIRLDIENQIDHKDFGRIRSIEIVLNDKSGDIIEVNKIDVSISKVGDGNSNKSVMNKDNDEYNLNDNKLTSNIKNSISKALGVDESVIRIRTQ